jgi:serine/threonine protein kinase
MATEINVLKYLEDKIKICSIPKIIYNFPEINCFGYKKIIGSHLVQELYLSLSPNEQNQLAKSLAQFLYEFHTTISLTTAHNIELRFANWPLLPKDLKAVTTIKNNLRLNLLFERFIQEYQYILNTTSSMVVHNDIHSQNILIDKTTNKLSGSIDFTSASIDTIYHEFRYLHLIDLGFLSKVLQAYSHKSNLILSLKNALFFCLATEFSRLSETPSTSHDYKEIVKRIHQLEQLL